VNVGEIPYFVGAGVAIRLYFSYLGFKKRIPKSCNEANWLIVLMLYGLP